MNQGTHTWYINLFSIALGTLLQLQCQAQESLDFSQNSNQYLRLAREYQSVQSDSTFRYANLAYKTAEAKGDLENKAEASQLLADVFTKYGVFSSAISHYASAIEYYESTGNYQKEADCRNALGAIYYSTKSKFYKLEQHQMALKLYENAGDSIGTGKTLGYIGHHFEKEEEYDSAMAYQERALNIFLELDDHDGLAGIYGHLGSIYEDLDDQEKAFYYFKLALEHNLLTGNTEQRIILFNNLGDTYRKRNRMDSAFYYTQRCYTLAQFIGHSQLLSSAQRDLAKSYAKIGQFDSAYSHLVGASTWNDKFYTDDMAERVSGLQTLFENQEKEIQIAHLQKEQELSAVNRRILWSVIGALLILAVLAIWFQRGKIYQQKKLLKTQNQLNEAKLQSMQLNEQKLKIELENENLKAQQLGSELELKNKALTSYALQIVQKNKTLKEVTQRLKQINKRSDIDKTKHLNRLVKEVDLSFKQDKDWEEFKVFFESVDPDFYPKLQKLVPDLTPTELRLCTLLRLNMSSKNIAAILKVAPDSIRIARYRLRKKMPLEDGENLVRLIMRI